ncbi:MAG: sugar O-acetyltransferase [Prevotella sp.]|jgi:maltose O-acetyltransferase|nr:sugar O-acetyltransferase [Prevotella sp.]MCI1281828.1 sugar O-acetyltransferase [Prevotella sp.]
MTEFEKMRSSQPYSYGDAEIIASFRHAKDLCARLTSLSSLSPDYRPLMEELIPGFPQSAEICTPFHCDHGNGIIIGEGTYINYNCTILDGACVRFGAYVKVGPNCQFYTPVHPHDFMQRREPGETCFPITIGDDAWICGGVIVCPGVTIGKRSIVAAGSVVIHDVPDDCLVAGNPAVIKKYLK